MPYPFLSAFIERRTGNRFSKKVIFDHSDFDDLLGKVIKQIEDKRSQKSFEKASRKQTEQEEIREWRQKLWEEQQHMAKDKQLK